MKQKYISSENLSKMASQFKVHFINSLGGFKSVSLIGTSNYLEQTNLAVFSSIFHIGANPPLIAFMLRPSPPERNTLSNILETGFYTINHINEDIYKQAHQTSARYPSEVSEFEATGLDIEYKNNFFAPFVKQSHIKFAVEFREKIDISLNNTSMVIGEIKEVYLPGNCLCEDGFIDLDKANTITCSGLDSYHKTLRLDRLTYAKPNLITTSLAFNYSE